MVAVKAKKRWPRLSLLPKGKIHTSPTIKVAQGSAPGSRVGLDGEGRKMRGN